MMNLGNIQQVSLREVWPNEARDFTPWLAENIDKLGNAWAWIWKCNRQKLR